MQPLDSIRRLYDHLIWADRRLLAAVRSGETAPEDALREFAHVIGTEEVWLARLERREPALAVWPPVASTDLERAVRETHEKLGAFVERLRPADLDAPVTYTNSAGVEFTNTIGDILNHLAMHGQYHRGKVNLLLRQADLVPEPVDYIAFVRGAPAATEADAAGPSRE